MIADWLDSRRMDKESRRILQQEGLVFHVTELIAQTMQEQGINKAELANRLGKSRSFVTQLLDGTANMTLKTVADVFTAMDLELQVSTQEPIWKRMEQESVPRKAQKNGQFSEYAEQQPQVIQATISDLPTTFDLKPRMIMPVTIALSGIAS